MFSNLNYCFVIIRMNCAFRIHKYHDLISQELCMFQCHSKHVTIWFLTILHLCKLGMKFLKLSDGSPTGLEIIECEYIHDVVFLRNIEKKSSDDEKNTETIFSSLNFLLSRICSVQDKGCRVILIK